MIVYTEEEDSFKCTLKTKHLTFIADIKENAFFNYTFLALVTVICIWQYDLLILSNKHLLLPQRKIEAKSKSFWSWVCCAQPSSATSISLSRGASKEGSVLHSPPPSSTCSHRA